MFRMGFQGHFALVLLLVGCTDKSVEADRENLRECVAAREQLDRELAEARQACASERNRWEAVSDVVEQRLPLMLGEVASDREEFVARLPSLAQEQVKAYLEGLISEFRDSITSMSNANERLSNELDELRRECEAEQSSALEERASTASKLSTLEARAEDSARLARLLAQEVLSFKSSRVSCTRCPGRLRLSSREREAIGTLLDRIGRGLEEVERAATPISVSDGGAKH